MVRAPPKVTGLSPKEGPPGTRIIIRGENFGTSANDLLSVFIGGVECVFQAEWQSASKLLCRSGNGQGLGDVIVTTKSGGRGTCTVQFRGYMDTVGPTKETAVWVDDSRFVDGPGRNQPQSPAGLVEGQDPLALSDEPSNCIYPEEQMLEMFPEGSGNITQENFVPAWYLLENHSGATLEDLKHGLRHMQSHNKHQSDGPIAFLKGHLGSYFECIDTLDNLEVRFGEDSDSFVENVNSLIEKVSSARQLSNYAYEAVFQRRQKIEFYRHCIATVQRFHYVFDLLSSIHKNTKSHNYRAVMTDYKKLHQLMGKSQVKVLQHVFHEIEAKVETLRVSLREELKIMPGNVDKQILMCRNLAELDDDGDRGWQCIGDLHSYITEKMFETYSFYFSDVTGAVHDVKRALQSKSFHHIDFRIQVASPFDLDFDLAPDFVPVEEPTSAPRDKHEVISSSTSVCQLIKVLSELATKQLRHFFRLCEAYFQSEMKEGGKDPAGVVDAMKYNRQREMVNETVHLFVAIIQCTLHLKETLIKPEEFFEAVTAIQHVQKTVSGHGESATILRTLLRAMKKSLIIAILERGTAEMESVAANAAERPDKTLRLASKMPELFTTVAVKTLCMSKQYMQEDPIDKTSILNEPGVADAVLDKWTRLIRVPVDTLHEFGETGTGIVVLFSLISVQTLIKKVLPRLFKMLDNSLTQSRTQTFRSSNMERYGDLSIDLTKAFVEMKAEPVMGVIEKQMVDHGLDWKHSPEPHGVNSYVTRIALDLNAVHEELCVFATEMGMNDEIMKGIVVKVCEEVNRLFFVAAGFNANGVLQGQVDLAALRLIIGPFLSKASITMLNEIEHLLKEQNPVKQPELIARVVGDYTKKHHMLMFSQ